MITVKPVRSSRELRRFIRLPWKIYRGDAHWVPPLISEQRRLLARSLPSVNQETRCLFLAESGGHPVGRLAVLIDPALNLVKGSQIGYFSLFDCINDEEVAAHLFEAAAEWLRRRGMRVLKGPVSPAGPHEDDSKGLLVEGFDRPPVFMTSYNPSYYQRLMEGQGFNKDFDVYAYLLSKDQVFAKDPGKIVEYAARRYGFRLETVDLTNTEREIRDIKRVLDLAVPAEWVDMIPPSLEEVRAVAERLRQVADPDFVVIARADHEPIGFAVGLPDYNQVFLHLNGRLTPLGLLKYFYYRRKITWLRVFVMFVVPAFRHKGVSHAMYHHFFRRAVAKGYTHAEGSTIGEPNVEMRRDIESVGGHRYKTYRIYQKTIGT
ncbi:MAG: GNAT family N-acetyltransferase [Syntrophobacterales bacterium]|jgi:GNAT superfamily N-acetyltransferase